MYCAFFGGLRYWFDETMGYALVWVSAIGFAEMKFGCEELKLERFRKVEVRFGTNLAKVT